MITASKTISLTLSFFNDQRYPFASYYYSVSPDFQEQHKLKQKTRHDHERNKRRTPRPTISRLVRPLHSRSQSHPIASHAVALLPHRPAGGVSANAAGPDIAGRVRVAAAGNFAGSDAVWIGDVLHRVRADAVGSGIGDALLRRRNPLQPIRLRPLHSLLRHRATLAA
ncbi:hypothetical protein LR48_Vigan102s009600 [Vigna angularis]|uniref:Uncharacterized protein n=1 Tax=Phaseolus angularis TaxID=3914 RepID=A0A0L9T4D9_PHAAN|nr:hypothetical protein LR48_Vigan102s009600 [Vigna angularis]